MPGAFLAFLMAVLSTVAPQPSPTRDTPAVDSTASVAAPERMLLSIDHTVVGNGTLNDTLDISLDSKGIPFAAFDLRLGVKGSLVEIIEILPGEIYDSCHWELFNARPVPSSVIGEESVHLWRAVGLAKITPDSTRPVCLGLQRRVSLARIVVQSPLSLIVPDTLIWINFCWDRCSDNTVAGASGDDLFTKAAVVQTGPARILNHLDDAWECSSLDFSSCIKPNKPNQPKPMIDFCRGFVLFEIAPDSTR